MLDDDFDIDEEFLQEVFEKEISVQKEAVKRPSDENLEPQNSFIKRLREEEEKTPAREEGKVCFDDSDEDFSQLLQESTSFDWPQEDIKRPESDKTVTTTKSKVQRKFPGPAGLLPQLERSVADHGECNVDLVTVLKPPPMVSSQSQSENVSHEAWKEATRVLDVRLGDPSCPLGRFTLAWVRQRAVAKRLPQHKVPFILVGVKTIDPSSVDPSVTLKDPSGEMQGIFHHELWSEYSSQLVPACVLALRQVGVISTGPFARHQCLNITANNVIAVFSPDNCRVTQVKPVPRDQLLSEVRTPLPQSPSPQIFTSNKTAKPLSLKPTPTLFSTIGAHNITKHLPCTPNSRPVPFQCSTPKSSQVQNPKSQLIKNPNTQNLSTLKGQNLNTPITQFFNPTKSQTSPPSSNTPSGPSQSVSIPSQPVRSGFNMLPTNFNNKSSTSVSQSYNTSSTYIPKSSNSTPISSNFTPKTSAVAPPKNSNFTPKSFTPKISSQVSSDTSSRSFVLPKTSGPTMSNSKTVLTQSSSQSIPSKLPVAPKMVPKTVVSQLISENEDVDSLLEGLDDDALFGDF